MTLGTVQMTGGAGIYYVGSLLGHTLTNAGTIQSTGGTNYIYSNGGVGNGLSFSNSGTVSATGGTLYLGNNAGDSVANTGTITASGGTINFNGGSTSNVSTGTITANGGTINFNGGTTSISNTGTLTATGGGIINFGGSLTAADLGGSIYGAGGTLNITGTLTDAGTLAAPTDYLSGGVFTLHGGTIIGGSVASSALQFSTLGGTLNGVTVSGAFGMPASAYFYVKGTTTLSGGTVSLSGANSIYANAASATLSNQDVINMLGGNINGDGNTGFALNNSGTISNGGTGSTTLYLTNYSGDVLTNSGTIEATSTTGNNSTVSIGWTGGGGTTITNTGTLEASGPNSTLNLGYDSTPLTFSNTSGTITATGGGTVNFYGTFTDTDLAEGTINGAGGTLNLDGTVNIAGSLPAPTSGIYTLDGGTINGGTVTSNALQFSNSGGVLNGVTVSGNFGMPVNAYYYVKGTTTLTGGTETWSGANNIYGDAASATLSNQGVVNSLGGTVDGDGNTGFILNNSGTISNGGTSNTTLYLANDSGDTLTNSGNIVAVSTTGNYSTVSVGWSGASTTVANTGLLEANGPNSTINIGYDSTPFTFSNTFGTITATGGGVVNFYGTFNDSELAEGTINGAGGTLNLDGTVNIVSSLPAPATGVFTLDGGTINGGIVTSNALQFSSSGGVLNAVSVSGDFGMPVNAYYYIKGTTTLSGGTETWAGGNEIYGDAAGATLSNQGVINALGGSINGAGYAGFVLNNSGTISNGGTGNTTLYLANQTGDTLTNNGTIEATSTTGNNSTVSIGWSGGATTITNAGGALEASGPNSTLNLGYNSIPFTFSNTSGTITATGGGTVDFYGAFTNAELAEGTINGGGGTLNLDGTVTITGALPAPATGVFTLDDGTINGGTVTSNALLFSTSGGVLNGVTVSGNFGMPAYAYYYVTGTTTLTGGTETWNGSNTIYAGAANATLDNLGVINSLGGNIDSGGYTGYTFNNSGTITNGGSGSTTLYVANYSGDIVTNTGTIEAVSTAGNYSTVALGWSGNSTTVTNAGLLEANGPNSTIDLGYNSVPFTFSNTGGTITATGGGTVVFYGAFTNAELAEGTINGSGGTLNLEGTVNITGSLAAPASGIFTLYDGTINGGTVTSNALQFSSSGGVLNGVTVSGNYGMPANAYFFGKGTTTLSGGTETWAGSNSIYGDAAGATVLNQGVVNSLGGDIDGDGYAGFTLNNSGTITNGGSGNTTLYLASYSGDTLTNSGTIEAISTAGNYSSVNIGYNGGGGAIINNTGTLEANGPNSTIFLGYNSAPLTFSNTGGTITATAGGTVDFYGAFTNAELAEGTINGAGGTLNLEGTVSVTGTLSAPTSGVYTLDDGTINGGTVASGALTFSDDTGTLSGVTMSGNFTIPPATYASFYANNNTTFTGGTMTFANGNYDSVYLNGPGTALTIAPSETWSGGMGIANEGSFPVTVLVEGLLDHIAASSYFYGYTDPLTILNSGTIETSGGGTLWLGYYSGDAITNEAGGTIEANASIMYLDSYQSNVTNLSGNTLTGGTWIAANNPGTLEFVGAANTIATNGAGTTIILSGSGSNIYSGSSVLPLEQTLTTNDGTLEVLAGRGYAATNPIVNNGTIQIGGGTFSTSALTDNSGSSLTGSGTFSVTGGVTIGTGATVSPGYASPNSYIGLLSFNTLTLGSGGAYTFDVANATGVAGTDFDSVSVSGPLTITSTPGSPFTIGIESINPGSGTPGMSNFNTSLGYQWTLVAATSISGFSASDFVINTSAFANSPGIGNFFLTQSGSDILLNFTPVPEPSTWALMAAGIAAAGYAGWRRRRAVRA